LKNVDVPARQCAAGAEKGRHYDKVPSFVTEFFDANELAVLSAYKTL
jgi:hypothetical protein